MNEVMMAEAGRQAEQLARKRIPASDLKKEARFHGPASLVINKKAKKKQNEETSAKSQHPTKGTHIDYSM